MVYAGSRDRTLRIRSAGCALGLLWIAACLVACDDEDGPTPEDSSVRPISADGGPARDAAADGGAASCAGKQDGSECGADRHCVRGACAFNLCGDGVVAGVERCDDGNQRTGDGCDPACRIEGDGCGDGDLDDGEECDDANWIDDDDCTNECTLNQCGNQRLELSEECDDGNTIDDDGCSNRCTVVQCRNGRIDPGEQCDDGNSENRDSCTNGCQTVECGNGKVEHWEECDDGNEVDQGDDCTNDCRSGAACGDGVIEGSELCEGPHQGLPGPRNRESICTLGAPSTEVDGEESSWLCADDCRAKDSYDACETCRDTWCREKLVNILGADMVAGCFEAINTDFGAGAADTCFLQQCTDMVNCAITSECWKDSATSITAGCYCGKARDVVMCQQMGPAADAPCTAEWQNGTHTVVNSDVLGLDGELSLPAGFGSFLLQCYVEHCQSECMQEPGCTSDADCAAAAQATGEDMVCCATGAEDNTGYHNFACTRATSCGTSGGLSSYPRRRACTADKDCPPELPHCSGKFVTGGGKKICDDRPVTP